MSRPITVPSENQSHENQPSMVGGHLKYIQGAASSMLGYSSGEKTKEEAVQEMKKANEHTGPPMQSSILGTVEKAVGDLTGCEGMSDEGKSRQAPAGGSEVTSGTG